MNTPIKKSFEHKSIFLKDIRIDMVQIPDVTGRIIRCIENKEYGSYIVVSNAYDLVCNSRDHKLAKAANSSILTVPDGFSLLLAARLKGYKLAKRVYGPELMREFLASSQKAGYRHFFYGSVPEVLTALEGRVKEAFPAIKIAGSFSPPFRPLAEEEKNQIAGIINAAQVDVLWVGLGTPKQQVFMYDFKDKLKVPVMIGVGAAFDFLAGTKPQAPRFMRDNGFEWLFRLLSEPKRLWKRYLVGNVRFIFLLLEELFRAKTRCNSTNL